MNPVYLSYFIDELTPVYGGLKNTILIEQTSSIQQGKTSNNLKITIPNHVGTHIDFPFHFNDSKKNSCDYSPEFWVFNKVGFLDCSIELVPEMLETISTDIELLILKTGFGKYRGTDIYWSSQPVIPSKFARLFKERFPNLRVFGFDLISLTSKLDRDEGKKAHVEFLITHDILILEDMSIDHLYKSPEKVIILPWQISCADGVPCTVISWA
jgi:arylformamidase